MSEKSSSVAKATVKRSGNAAKVTGRATASFAGQVKSRSKSLAKPLGSRFQQVRARLGRGKAKETELPPFLRTKDSETGSGDD